MMSVSRAISFVFLFIVAVSSCKTGKDCPPVQHYELSASLKQWLPYISDSILVFEDSALLKDTIRLKSFSSGDEGVAQGEDCAPSTGEYIIADFIDTKTTDTIHAVLRIAYVFDLRRKNTFASYNDAQAVLSFPTSYRRFDPTITLNGKTYSNTISVECSAEETCTPAGITKYYFSKTKGMVAFERNGVLWTLV